METPMHRMFATALLSTALALPLAAQETRSVEVDLARADGTSAGTATFTETPGGLLIEARLENLPEGAHGFHIHETGACSPDFGAAGGHYAPDGASHGYLNDDGFHAGDLPNVHVEADGTATADFYANWLTLAEGTGAERPFSLGDDDGSAIMIHAEGDDYRADPPGSTGSRIACGVIVPDAA